MDRHYNWYTLYVKTHHEKRVCKDLTEKNIQTLLPLLRKKRKWADRLKIVEEPMFPNYLFVRVSCMEYYHILNHKSVISFVSFSGKPYVVSEKTILAIENIISRGILFDLTSQEFNMGDIVKFDGGPFKGMSGELVNKGNEKFLIIRLEHVNQNILIKTERLYLTKVKRPDIQFSKMSL